MRPVLVALGLLAAGTPLAAQNQRVRLQLFGVRATNQEIDSTRNATGQGAGGAVEVRLGRVSLELNGYQADLEPDDSTFTPYTLQEGDVRLFVRVLNPDQAQGSELAVMLGAGGRKMDPALAAVDVGVVRFGIRARAPMTRLAELGIRAAYVAPRFSGGGDAGFAFEVGLDLGIGTRNGRFRFQTGFDFQRIDRTVGGVDAPVQFTVSRAGIQVAL